MFYCKLGQERLDGNEAIKIHYINKKNKNVYKSNKIGNNTNIYFVMQTKQDRYSQFFIYYKNMLHF